MQDVLVKAFYSFVWCLCITIPINYYIGEKINRKMLCFTLYTFIVCFAVTFIPKSEGTVITITSVIILVFIIYKKPILSSVKITIIWFLATTIGEFAAFYIIFIIFKAPTNRRNEDIFLVSIIHIIILVLSLSVIWLIKNIKLRKGYFTKHIKTFSIVIISTAVILFFVLMSFQAKILNSLSVNVITYVYLSAITLILLFILVNIYIVNIFSYNKYQMKLKEGEYKNLMLYTQSVEEISRDIRKRQHDFNNFLLAIKGYLEMSDYESLKKLIFTDYNTYNQESKDLSYYYQLRNISDSGLKGLLAAKLSNIGNLDIEVKIDIENEFDVPENINKIDIYRIIGILIDNAIEAVKKCLSVVIIPKESEIKIKIENDYNQKPNMNKLFTPGYSTKGNSHGLGLPIVQEIKENYTNIDIKVYLQEDIFVQEVIIEI